MDRYSSDILDYGIFERLEAAQLVHDLQSGKSKGLKRKSAKMDHQLSDQTASEKGSE